jgi:tetrahydromethanopterin S-methyltransferase subunit G
MSTTHENQRLDSMAQELESIKGEVFEMKTMVKDIHTLLAGNPIDKNSGGLLKDFKEMKSELDDIKDQLRKYKAYFYALVSLIGIGALKVIIEFLTSK